MLPKSVQVYIWPERALHVISCMIPYSRTKGVIDHKVRNHRDYYQKPLTKYIVCVSKFTVVRFTTKPTRWQCVCVPRFFFFLNTRCFQTQNYYTTPEFRTKCYRKKNFFFFNEHNHNIDDFSMTLTIDDGFVIQRTVNRENS